MQNRRIFRKRRYYVRAWTWPAFLLSFAVFMVGVGGSAVVLRQGQQEAHAFETLVQLIDASSQAAPEGQAAAKAEEPSALEAFAEAADAAGAVNTINGMGAAELFQQAQRPMLKKYAALYSQNTDMAGWVNVPGTRIDYPVMSTPADPHYYLHRGFYKQEAKSGTPFYGDGCTDDSDCLLIYAHNMRNDTMFGSLDLYEKKAFWEKNQQVWFDTLYEEREYQIISVFKGRVLYQNEEGFRYYRYGGDLNKAQFDELMAGIRGLELYSTGLAAEYGDSLLMLSTCSNHGENDRLVVVAKRIKDQPAAD